MIDLYSFGTPNGQKVTMALAELGLEYKMHTIDIQKGDQFKPDFLKISPNNKIPALVDGENVIFESVAILIYLADKTGKLLPKTGPARYETLSWCFFQAASVGPMFGQLGHFKVYAKEQIPYAIERYTNEVNRLFKVMDTRLEKTKFLGGDEYSIADIATWPWISGYQKFYKQELDRKAYPNVGRWFDSIAARDAAKIALA